MSSIYSVAVADVSIATNELTVVQLLPTAPATMIHILGITFSTNAAALELGALVTLRAQATAGVGGVAATPTPVSAGAPAAKTTALVGPWATTEPTAGALYWQRRANVLDGLEYSFVLQEIDQAPAGVLFKNTIAIPVGTRIAVTGKGAATRTGTVTVFFAEKL